MQLSPMQPWKMMFIKVTSSRKELLFSQMSGKNTKFMRLDIIARFAFSIKGDAK